MITEHREGNINAEYIGYKTPIRLKLDVFFLKNSVKVEKKEIQLELFGPLIYPNCVKDREQSMTSLKNVKKTFGSRDPSQMNKG